MNSSEKDSLINSVGADVKRRVLRISSTSIL